MAVYYNLRLAKDGANFSINSDDPTLFNNTLADDYIFALEMGLTKQDIVASVSNVHRFTCDSLLSLLIQT